MFADTARPNGECLRKLCLPDRFAPLRQLGTLPDESQARSLADHLLALGITTRLDSGQAGWTLWIHNEDRLAQARQELDAFRANPGDPRYQHAVHAARAVLREQAELERRFQKNNRSMSGQWDRLNLRRRPLTIALVAICVVVYLVMESSDEGRVWVLQHLPFTSLVAVLRGGPPSDGLDPLRHGEYWRLITPIFIHFGIIHLLFDVWALLTFGTIIEYLRGWKTLAGLVLLSALASNAGEYAFEMNFHGQPHLFGGISGVVFALFGYMWMKGRYEPEHGMILHPRSVQMMLFWLVLCMTGAMGNIANGAHVVGLIVGILYGLARF
jgi:GlpG protein